MTSTLWYGSPSFKIPCLFVPELVTDNNAHHQSPNGDIRPAKTRMLPDGKTKVLFTCDTPGKNKIVTKFDDKEVKQCSFQVEAKKIGDHSKCIFDGKYESASKCDGYEI